MTPIPQHIVDLGTKYRKLMEDYYVLLQEPLIDGQEEEEYEKMHALDVAQSEVNDKLVADLSDFIHSLSDAEFAYHLGQLPRNWNCSEIGQIDSPFDILWLYIFTSITGNITLHEDWPPNPNQS